MPRTVHVIGAGLAGLSAAVELQRRGRRIVLHDAHAHAGGRCRSWFDGTLNTTLDSGLHQVFAGQPAMQRYLRAIGAADQLAGPALPEFAMVDVASQQRWTLRFGDGRWPSWLFDAAARAGIERIVYVSILHADTSYPYPYFSGKGEVERHLAAAGVPYAIARPAILFGSSADLGVTASVLVNNIAWLLRHLPVFGVGDGGGYRIRPVHVDDLARLLVELGGRADNVTVDAVGPDAPTFREAVNAIRAATGSHALLVPTPGWLIPPLSAVLGAALRDVLLTAEEYQAMAAGRVTPSVREAAPARPGRWPWAPPRCRRDGRR